MSSNTDTLGWHLTRAANPKHLLRVFDNLGMIYHNQLSLHRKLYFVVLNMIFQVQYQIMHLPTLLRSVLLRNIQSFA